MSDTMPDECEEARRQSLADIDEETAAKFKPGGFGCHEASHTSSLLTDQVARQLLEHPSIILDAELYRLAWEAHGKLFDLYQAIGGKHLQADTADVGET